MPCMHFASGDVRVAVSCAARFPTNAPSGRAPRSPRPWRAATAAFWRNLPCGYSCRRIAQRVAGPAAPAAFSRRGRRCQRERRRVGGAGRARGEFAQPRRGCSILWAAAASGGSRRAPGGASVGALRSPQSARGGRRRRVSGSDSRARAPRLDRSRDRPPARIYESDGTWRSRGDGVWRGRCRLETPPIGRTLHVVREGIVLAP